jgi:hypothetical protein
VPLWIGVLLAGLTTPALAQQLQVHPQRIQFRSADDTAQLVVTAVNADGTLTDATHTANYTAKGGTVSATGRVRPTTNGAGQVVVQLGSLTVTVPLTASQIHDHPPMNFANQVVPVFTKLGCNSGGCHGKLSGQNHFRLSLLGFDAFCLLRLMRVCSC